MPLGHHVLGLEIRRDLVGVNLDVLVLDGHIRLEDRVFVLDDLLPSAGRQRPFDVAAALRGLLQDLESLGAGRRLPVVLLRLPHVFLGEKGKGRQEENEKGEQTASH